MRKVHESITMARVMAAVQEREDILENPGFCLTCGERAEDCEPDACHYMCESCGERQVFGAEEIMMMGIAR